MAAVLAPRQAGHKEAAMIHLRITEEERNELIACIVFTQVGASPQAYAQLEELRSKIDTARNLEQGPPTYPHADLIEAACADIEPEDTIVS